MWGVLISYFAVILFIGFWASRMIKNRSDSEGYFLGGKSFGPLFSSFKYATTVVSAGDIVSAAGMCYTAGMPGYAQAYSNPIAFFLSMRVYGPRIKAACDHFNVLTVPQLLYHRYKSKTVRFVGALCIAVALGGTMVAQFKAMGEVFSVLLEIKYIYAVLIGALIVAVYSLAGGYTASVWTDFLQGSIMLIGSVILNYYCQIAAFGKFMMPWELFPALYKYIGTVNPAFLTITGGGLLGISTLVVYTLINLSCGIAMPQQTIVLFSIKSIKALKFTALFLVVIALTLLWSVNPAAMMAHKILPTALENADQIIPTLTLQVMPSWAAGIFLAAILSAIMSTVDGIILVASSAITQDVLKNTMGEKYEKNSVMYDRLVVGVFAAITMLFALRPPTIIFFIMAFAFAMLLFTFVLPMLGVIFFPKVNKYGAISAMLAGVIVMPFWTIIGEPVLPAMFLGLIVSPAAFIIGNLIGIHKKIDENDVTQELWQVYKAIKW